MKISLDSDVNTVLIKACDDGQITVNGRVFTHSLMISPQGVRDNWEPTAVAELRVDDLAPALELNPQILLLGTGKTHCFPPAELMGAVLKQNVGLEVMTTDAACRTYNVLVSEGRSVVAALIIE